MRCNGPMYNEEPGMIRRFAGVVGAGMLLVGPVSFADPAATTASSDAGGLEEITVTAERRQESAQSVGIAMQVLSGENLAAKSITYVNDLQNAAPSLQIEPAFGSSQPQFRLRGVGFIDYTSNNASPVGVSIDDVDVYVPHQANVRIIDHATKKLGVPSDRVVINVDRYGNTSSGSIPLALAEAQADGRLREGSLVLMTGMGAGLTWGSALMRWTAGSPS